ncbi:L,D-transpeptidase, partial [Actinomycetospora sp.]|uniref:L,D-transpeptidase n=1 Tax=Actinomycetospora sp. TaxID=1872135 RepID=UPI002F3EC40B
APTANATDVAPKTDVSVSVPDGRLTGVALTPAGGGKAVDGTLSPDGKRWVASGPLALATSYTWSGTATAGDGRTSPLAGSLRTIAPKEQVEATLNIGDGRTVGVAAPVEIQFDGHVADRAAAERTLKVGTSKPTEGSWAWLPDQDGGSRVHWRPKEYWDPGTKVTVTADLLGVDLGDGAFGREDVSSHFTVGRSQIVKADVNSFRMIVMRDGKQVMDVPASYGIDADPNRTTRSGTHVVSEKFTDKRMVSRQYDYDVVEQWAVRMSNNGEFIHANPKSAAAQGTSNVTHGCVNLSIGDAKAYYDTAMYGDPVEVTGTPIQLSARDGDIYDWTVPWSTWKGQSAL